MIIHQRILRVLSIMLVVLSVCEMACSLAGLGLGVYLFQNPDISAAILANSIESSSLSASDIPTFLVFIGFLLGFCGLLTLPVGILGMKGAKNPAKIKPFIVVSIIILVFNVIAVVVEETGQSFSLDTMTMVLTPIFFQSLALYCAITTRRLFVQGKIELSEKAIRSDLGFIRVVQVFYVLSILFTLVSSMMLISGNYTLGASDILIFANLVFNGVGFWLIVQRSSAARWWIIGTGVFNIVVGNIFCALLNDFDVLDRLVSSGLDLILILYFALAKRPKKLLVKKFSLSRQKELVVESWDLWKPKSLDFWRAMVIYYCLFSIAGHWMEAGFCTLIRFHIIDGIYDPSSGIWRDYLSPFPVYGFGMVACAVLLFPIKTKLQEKLGGTWKPLVLSFIINTLVCSGIELSLGLMQNMPNAQGVYPLWDYSTMPFNFMGQICLQNSLAFGIASTLMTWVVFPVLQKTYLQLPLDVKKVLFVAVIAFYALVICLYMINI